MELGRVERRGGEGKGEGMVGNTEGEGRLKGRVGMVR